MATKKITKQEAKALAKKMGISFYGEFFTLSKTDVSNLVAIAKLQDYRKSKTAKGSTGRMYFEYLSKVK